MKKTIAIIGAGNMGGAIAEAVCRKIDPKQVAVTRKPAEAAKELAEKLCCIAERSNCDAAKDAKFVMLGVKPGMVDGVLKELLPVLSDGQVIVSMAAGVAIADIKKVTSLPVVRLLPNTPASIGQGLMLMAVSDDVKEEDLVLLEELLSSCGKTGRISEQFADIALVMGGCVPAYTYMFIEALADGGVKAGLPRAQAQEYAASAVMGAAAMVLETGKHPEELKDAVCSPGGTTIAGVLKLEEKGMRSAAAEAVLASYNRSTEVK